MSLSPRAAGQECERCERRGAPGAPGPLGLLRCPFLQLASLGPSLTSLQIGHPRQEGHGEKSYLTTDSLSGSLRKPSQAAGWQSLGVEVGWAAAGRGGGGEPSY